VITQKGWENAKSTWQGSGLQQHRCRALAIAEERGHKKFLQADSQRLAGKRKNELMEEKTSGEHGREGKGHIPPNDIRPRTNSDS